MEALIVFLSLYDSELGLGWTLCYLYRHFCVAQTRLMIEFDIMIAPNTTDTIWWHEQVTSGLIMDSIIMANKHSPDLNYSVFEITCPPPPLNNLLGKVKDEIKPSVISQIVVALGKQKYHSKTFYSP